MMLNTSIDNKHFFEQLDDYIEELKEAGYEWDAKLKQLRKIEQKHEENLRK